MPILPIPVTRTTPRKLTLPLTSRPPPDDFKLRKVNFVFVPKQSKPEFWFLFRDNLPPSHALEHSWFCKANDCPYHY